MKINTLNYITYSKRVKIFINLYHEYKTIEETNI